MVKSSRGRRRDDQDHHPEDHRVVDSEKSGCCSSNNNSMDSSSCSELADSSSPAITAAQQQQQQRESSTSFGNTCSNNENENVSVVSLSSSSSSSSLPEQQQRQSQRKNCVEKDDNEEVSETETVKISNTLKDDDVLLAAVDEDKGEDGMQMSADEYKERGNRLFKQQNYAAACVSYRKALAACNNTNNNNNNAELRTALWSNLAILFLKQKNYEQAERATRTILVDLSVRNNPKVWFRRALAREGRANQIITTVLTENENNRHIAADSKASTGANNIDLLKLHQEAEALLAAARSDLQESLRLLENPAVESGGGSSGGGGGGGADAFANNATKRSVAEVAKRIQIATKALAESKEREKDPSCRSEKNSGKNNNAVAPTQPESIRHLNNNNNNNNNNKPRLAAKEDESSGDIFLANGAPDESPHRHHHKPPPPPPPPSQQQQRQDVFRLLVSRIQNLESQTKEGGPSSSSSSSSSSCCYAGEALFLIDWAWWCRWCSHVDFFYTRASNYDAAQKQKLASTLLGYLPPGAGMPPKKSPQQQQQQQQQVNGDEDSSSTTSESSDDEYGEESHGPPGAIDNSRLFMFPPYRNRSTESANFSTSQQLFFRQWYTHSQLCPQVTDDFSLQSPQPPSPNANNNFHPLKPNLVRGHHYELLPREVYCALRSWYQELTPSLCRRTVLVPRKRVGEDGTNDDSTANKNPSYHVVLPLFPGIFHKRHIKQYLPSGHRCSACFAITHVVKRCKRCLAVYYCDRKCQDSHWSFHRLECKSLRTVQGNGDQDDGFLTTSTTAAKRNRDGDFYFHPNSTVGLNNLGNTCFMNSALQCLSHATPLTRYFLSNMYQVDLNPSNPLGTGGKLAKAYGATMRELWMRYTNLSKAVAGAAFQHYSISPTALKRAIAQFAPRFAGCLQHDSQEFLAFLLDGLHEDLNRIVSPPYVVQPDVKSGSCQATAAALCWDTDNRRNDSLIRDTFYGQFKSTCHCPRCDRVSVSFDAFNHVSLEIPRQSVIADAKKTVPLPIPVLFFRAVPFESGDRGNIKFSSMNKKPVLFGIPVMAQERSFSAHNQRVVMVASNARSFKQQLSKATGIAANRLVLCEVYDCNIVDILDDDRSMQEVINSVISGPKRAASICATDQADSAGVSWLAAYEVDPYTTTNCYHTLISHKLQCRKNGCDDQAIRGIANRDKQVKENEIQSQPFGFPLMKSFPSDWTCRQLWNHIWDGVEYMVMHEDFSEGEKHRNNSNSKRSDILQIRCLDGQGQPMTIFPANGKDKTALAHKKNDDLADSNITIPEKSSLIPEHSDTKLVDFLGEDSVEKFLNLALEWKNRFSEEENIGSGGKENSPEGHRSTTKQRLLPVIDKSCFLSFDKHVTWLESAKQLATFYGSSQASSINHSKMNANNAVTLDECFETFTKPERLDEHNTWYCSTCKEHVRAMKTMQLWRLPNILIVHLKRFEFKPGLHMHFTVRRDKLDTTVNFPLEGLDMSKHSAEVGLLSSDSDSSFCVDSNVPAVYDLFGVVNHYGRMGFGHYTAFCRRWDETGISDQWQLFDDSSVRDVSHATDAIVSAAAYVLFYRRRNFN